MPFISTGPSLSLPDCLPELSVFNFNFVVSHIDESLSKRKNQ